MKPNAVIILICIFAIVSCQEDYIIPNKFSSTFETRGEDSATRALVVSSDTLFSKADALKIVEPIAIKYPGRSVDISDAIIPAESKIGYNKFGHELKEDKLSFFSSPEFDSWLVVIGPDPTILGCQKQLHIFVNIETGDICEQWVDGRAIVDWDTSRYTYIYDGNRPTIQERNVSTRFNTISNPYKWAVIISGGTYPNDNYQCFYKDTKQLYNELVDILGYPSDNIFCLMSDGNDSGLDQLIGEYTYINSNPDLDGDGISDVYSAASLPGIRDVFTNLHFCTAPGDEVLVCLVGHCDDDGKFYLWDGSYLSPSEFNIQLNKLGSTVMVDVVLATCYAGKFIPYISSVNRTIATSCSATETSHVYPYGGGASCFFLSQWIESIATYDAVSINDAYIAPLELYNDAKYYIMTINVCTEHPQFDSTPSSFGSSHSLKGEQIPSIIGSDYLSTNFSSTYSIVNHDDLGTVTWAVGNNASLVSHTDSSAVIRGVLETSQFCGMMTTVGATLNVAGKMHHLSKTIDSVWKPGFYVDKNHIWGSNGTYRVRHLGGEYGYVWSSNNPAWQIINYNSDVVAVSEGYTDYPVSLIATFYDPLGEQITVMERVH